MNKEKIEFSKFLVPPLAADIDEDFRNPNIKIYNTYLEAINLLEDCEAGKVVQGIFAYACDHFDKIPDDMQPLTKVIFDLITIIIDNENLIYIYEHKDEIKAKYMSEYWKKNFEK